MSRDVEAGVHNEETIPLVKVLGRDKHSNDDEDDRASGNDRTTSPSLNNTGKEDAAKRQEIMSDMADDQNVESKMKYKIDICEDKGEEMFKFTKMKTKSSADEIAKDAEKFVKIAEFRKVYFNLR